MTTMKDKIATLIATGLYSGYMRPYPGTWGTIPAWLIAYFLLGGDTLALSIAAIVCTAVSVWAAGNAEKSLGHDARKIVIDEWAGMFISLILVPFSPATYALAFFAFRFFDVVKIPPAAQAERLPGGWGVTADDIVAGIHANIAVQVFLYVVDRFELGVPFFS
ncbi:MAG: phosphatidylglycerophosphatase A, partial [candidate division Zixibacteria bacterium]|nr:phosphatidylglycerophosphatase A [candidate division Zixibacteria bacterium]